MKRNSQIIVGIVWAVGMCTAASAFDRLYGKWIETRDTNTLVVFTASNVTVSVHGTQEVWRIVDSTDRRSGLFASRAGITNKIVMATKFNEMIFRLGDWHWVLRKDGTDMSGVPPPPGGWNQPPTTEGKKP